MTDRSGSSSTVDTRTVAGAAGPLSIRRQGQGEPVILLHPLALAGSVWSTFAERLAAEFDVIAPDARGHGHSGWDGHAFTIVDLADDVIAIMNGLQLPAAHLVGMSMGGSTAIACAGTYPERVLGLALADTTAWYGSDAPATWAERAERAETIPRPDQVPFQVDRWFTEAFRRQRPDVVDEVVSTFLATDSRAHAAASRALGGMDSRAQLAAVTAPTLVLTGVEDYATPPEMGAVIAAGVAHGTARVLDGLRHLSLIQEPTLADDIGRHLATSTAAKARS